MGDLAAGRLALLVELAGELGEPEALSLLEAVVEVGQLPSGAVELELGLAVELVDVEESLAVGLEEFHASVSAERFQLGRANHTVSQSSKLTMTAVKVARR